MAYPVEQQVALWERSVDFAMELLRRGFTASQVEEMHAVYWRSMFRVIGRTATPIYATTPPPTASGLQ